jgi:hypothetical protein
MLMASLNTKVPSESPVSAEVRSAGLKYDEAALAP